MKMQCTKFLKPSSSGCCIIRCCILMNLLKWMFTGQARDVGRSRKAVLQRMRQAISLLYLFFCSVNGQLLGLGGVTRAHWAELPGSKGQANDSTGAGALKHWLCTAPRG